jgi:hypothetical protein
LITSKNIVAFDVYRYRIETWAEKCRGPWAGEPEVPAAAAAADEYADDDDGASEHHEKAHAKAKAKRQKHKKSGMWLFG